MATKITRRWANAVADGTHELFDASGFQPRPAKAGEAAPPRLENLSDLFREGQTLVEVTTKLGISKSSYYKACALSKRFNDAHKLGMEKAEAWWMTLGRAGAAGKAKIQPATWIFTTKNRFGYSDKQDLVARVSNVENIENNTIKPEMTPDEAAKIYNTEILHKV